MNSRESLRAWRSNDSCKSLRRGSRARRMQAVIPVRYRIRRRRALMMKRNMASISPGDQVYGPAMPSKPVNVKPVMVYLTHEQHAALLKLKEKLDTPVSEQIRRAIDRYLKQMESRK
jgi:hypothetical protein